MVSGKRDQRLSARFRHSSASPSGPPIQYCRMLTVVHPVADLAGELLCVPGFAFHIQRHYPAVAWYRFQHPLSFHHAGCILCLHSCRDGRTGSPAAEVNTQPVAVWHIPDIPPLPSGAFCYQRRSSEYAWMDCRGC